MIEVGLKHISELVVNDEMTAQAMGSGDMPVLATPAMMALMENAAMLAVAPELPKAAPPWVDTSHRLTCDPPPWATR